MNKIKLLLVEDDESLAFIIKGSLELTGHYDVYTAVNGKEGVEAYGTFKPDVIVSDIEMPEMCGQELVSLIRQKDRQIPILLATARTSSQDVIQGYNLGADNYIKKPYLVEELDAQIQAILRRTLPIEQVTPDNSDIYPIGLYKLHLKHRYLQLNDKHTKLTEREVLILWMLYDQKGEIVKRDDILMQFWGGSNFYVSRSLDVFIRNLRKYLSDDPSIQIETIRGKGFKLSIG